MSRVHTPVEERHGSVVDGYNSPRSRSLWWVYLLVTLALAGMGAGAAQALFVTNDLGGIAAVQRCLSQHGISVSDVSLAVPARDSRQFAACAAEFNHRHGVAMLVGAAALPAVAWLLMLCGGLGVRWRLRRSRGRVGSTPSVRDAISRFEAWCDAGMLTGRRRPRLLLAAPGTSTQAFTTGFPLARPLVVVPLSYAYAEPAQFDIVVLHELAHVRSRDLLWASSVWWAGWLSVPALLLAVAPLLSRPQLVWTLYSTSLGLAVALSVAVLVLRVGLLRRRELAADRYALDITGDARALRTALGQDTADAPPGRKAANGLLSRFAHVREYAQRVTASHPSLAARVEADPAAVDRWGGGFAFTATAGLVAMVTFQSVYFVLVDLLGFTGADPGLPSDLALAIASLLWAAVVVPAWTRRVEAASRTGSSATWWGPWAGVLAGLIAGYYLQIPGASTVVGSTLFAGHLPLLLTSLVLITAGIGVLAAGVATRLAGRGRSPGRRVLGQVSAVLAVAAALTTAWSATVTMLVAHLRLGSAGDRSRLSELGDDRAWRFAPLLVLAGLVIAVWTTRAPGWAANTSGSTMARVLGRRLPRTYVPVMAVSVLVGGLAAVLSWQLRTHSGQPDYVTYVLVYQRWWICAFAGWAALAALLWAGRPSQGDRVVVGVGSTHAAAPTDPGSGGDSGAGHSGARRVDWSSTLASLPAALIAGLLTAVLAALLQFLAIAATGTGRSLHNVQETLRLPMWLLFVTAVLTLPWLLLGAGLTGPARRNSRYALGAGITIGVLSLALVGGLMSPVTVAAHDYDYIQAVSAGTPPGQPSPANPVTPPTPARDPHRTADPGRPLDQAAATGAIANIATLLPLGATVIDNSPDTLPEITPTACRDTLARDNAAEKALPRTATIKRTYQFPAQGTSHQANLVLTVTSYVTPQRDFTDAHHETASCAHFHVPVEQVDNGYLNGTLSDGRPPDLPYLTYRADFNMTGRGNSMLLGTKSPQDSMLIGHNSVSASITYSYLGTPPPASVQQSLEQLLPTILTAVAENLRSAPPSH